MITQIKALNQANQEVGVRATEGGILIQMKAQVLWTAKGYGKQAMSTTAAASLVVRPSTTAMVTLFNNESAGGKHYFIERVFAHMLVTDVSEVGSIWLVSHPVGMTAPGDDITVRNSPSGQAAGGSLSQFGIDETVVDNGWFPWGNANFSPLDGTVPGAHIEAEVDGRIIVPPQAGLSLQVVSSTTTNTYTAGFHWFEVPESELIVI